MADLINTPPPVAFATAQADPGNNTLVGAVRSTHWRWVFGTASCTSTIGNLASIRWEVETGPGTDVYVELWRIGAPLSIVGPPAGFGFPVPPGCRYRYVKGGLGGVVENLVSYGFMDIPLQS
jgi:hypothetical protein